MTDYVMLECNRLRGRQSYNPFNEKTDEYKNRWVNNVSSYGITINKGDIINVESVAVNTSGTIQDTIEILADENEDGVMDNTIGLEFLYYINNSGYSGIPLPLLNMTTYIGYDNSTLTNANNCRNRGLGEVNLTGYSTLPGTEYNDKEIMPKQHYNNVAVKVINGFVDPLQETTKFEENSLYTTSDHDTINPRITIKAEKVDSGSLVYYSISSLTILPGVFQPGLQTRIIMIDPTQPSATGNHATILIYLADTSAWSKNNIQPDGRRYYPANKNWTGCCVSSYTGMPPDDPQFNYLVNDLTPYYSPRATSTQVTIPSGLSSPQNLTTLITEKLQKPYRADLQDNEFVDLSGFESPVVNTQVSKAMSCNFNYQTSPYDDTSSLTGVRNLFYSNIALENPQKWEGLQFSRQFYYGINNDDTRNEINSGNQQSNGIGDFGNQEIGELGLNMCITRVFPNNNSLVTINNGQLILTNVYFTEDNIRNISLGFRKAEKYYGDSNFTPNSNDYKSSLGVSMDLGLYYDQASNPTLKNPNNLALPGQRFRFNTGREGASPNIVRLVDSPSVCLGSIPPYFPSDSTNNDEQQLSSIVVKSRYTTAIDYQELYTHLTNAGGDDMKIDPSTSFDEVFNNSWNNQTIDYFKALAIKYDLGVVPVFPDTSSGEYYKSGGKPYIAFVNHITTNTSRDFQYNKFSNLYWNIDSQNMPYGIQMGLDCSFIRNKAMAMINNTFSKDLITNGLSDNEFNYQGYMNVGSYGFNIDFDDSLSRCFISDMNTPIRTGNGQPYDDPVLKSYLGLVAPTPDQQVVNCNLKGISFNFLNGYAGGDPQFLISDFNGKQNPISVIDSITGININSLALYDSSNLVKSSKFYWDDFNTTFTLQDTLLGKLGFTQEQFFPIIGTPQTLFNKDTFNVLDTSQIGYFEGITSFTRPLTTGGIFGSPEFQATQTNTGSNPLYLLGGVMDSQVRPSTTQAKLIATNEPSQLSYAYLCVYSSIIQGGTSSKWHGGIDSKSQIPCVAYCPRYDNAGSFFYGLQSSFTFTATKDFSISEIETDIRLPDGSRPRLLPHSSVIYKIIKPLNLPVLLQK